MCRASVYVITKSVSSYFFVYLITHFNYIDYITQNCIKTVAELKKLYYGINLAYFEITLQLLPGGYEKII